MRALSILQVLLGLSALLCGCGARSSLVSGGDEGTVGGGHGTGRTLSASWSHSCAIVEHGKVVCWGQWGATPATPSPILIGGLDRIVEIAAGENGDCARRADGTVWCWGVSTGGEPVQIQGAKFSSFTTGAGASCGVTGSGVACVGAPFLDGASCNIGLKGWSPTATTVPGLSGVAGLSVGQWHACAFAPGGATSCWGCAGGPPPEGKWNLGSMVPNTLTPVAVPGVSSTVLLAAETSSTCAVQTNGDTICWGEGLQFGPGIVAHPIGPTLAGFPPSPLDLDVGVTFSCAAYPGEVRCLGGIPTFADGCMDRRDLPTSFSLADIAELSVGYQHVCARDTSGAVWCWGCNTVGEVGDGTKTPRGEPVRVL
ncbi:MAG: hypothetical protein QM820_06865 [Minicystis sp.]